MIDALWQRCYDFLEHTELELPAIEELQEFVQSERADTLRILYDKFNAPGEMYKKAILHKHSNITPTDGYMLGVSDCLEMCDKEIKQIGVNTRSIEQENIQFKLERQNIYQNLNTILTQLEQLQKLLKG